jgi:hypothetical protein
MGRLFAHDFAGLKLEKGPSWTLLPFLPVGLARLIVGETTQWVCVRQPETFNKTVTKQRILFRQKKPCPKARQV